MGNVGTVAVEMRTDAYTVCRGAGHIDYKIALLPCQVKPNFMAYQDSAFQFRRTYHKGSHA